MDCFYVIMIGRSSCVCMLDDCVDVLCFIECVEFF